MTRAGTGFVALLLAGCGGSSLSATDIEHKLADSIRQRDGSTLEQPTCVKHNGNTFRCVGELHASRKAAQADVGGIDTSAWTEADWQAIEARNSGPVTFDVTVGDDGRWVSTPVN